MKHVPYWVVDTVKCVLIVLIGLAVLWLLFSVGSLFGPDQGAWRKAKLDWNYGSIDIVDGTDGEKDVAYVSGFDALYTRDLIKCTGYEVTVSFPAGVRLDVHYFDAEDKYIGTKTIDDERFVSLKPGDDELPAGAVGIRLCLTPDSGEDFELVFGLGASAKKWKYSSYVKLSITNADASGVKVPSGV